MESNVFSTFAIRCILCSSIEDPNNGFLNIDEKQMPNSKKTVKSVLIHLSKCIKKNYDFNFYTTVCSCCFKKLVEYDEIMIRLLFRQKELGNMLENSMKRVMDQEIETESVHDDVNSFQIELVKDDLDNEIESLIDEEDSATSSSSDEEATSANDLSEGSDKLVFQCSLCDSTFKSKRAQQIHQKTHAKLVSCHICGATKKDEEYLELHMNIHEGKTENECRYCPKKYTRRSHVIRHMHIHWDKKKFQCEKCGLRFSQANILYNHKMNHEAEEEPIICNVCHQTFKSKRTFKHHMITHQEDRPMYPCEICGKVFTQKYTIKAHLKTHVEGNDAITNTSRKIKSSKRDTKGFPCIICDKICSTKESLEMHMAQQHDVINESEDGVYI